MKKHAYSAALTALVIALIVLVNLAVGQLPSSVRELDMSSQGIYTVSQTSVDYLANLQEEVNVTVLQAKDQVDPRIVRFVARYAALSEKLSVQYIDPVAYPSAPSTYNASQGDMVVQCAATGRSEIVPLSGLIGYNQLYYYYYGQYVETDFDVEGQLTAAIDAVVGEVSQSVYCSAGHGEADLADAVTTRIDKLNLGRESLTLMQVSALPEDCGALIFNAPDADLTAQELELVRSYLSSGGQVVILLGTGDAPLPNFTALLEEYGLQPTAGYIADPERYYQSLGTPYAIFPQGVSGSALTANWSESDLLLMYNARGLTQVDPQRDSITVEPFLTTSSQALAVTETEQTEGSYVLAAVCEESGGGRLTVYSSASFVDQSILSSFSNVKNDQLFLDSLTAGMEDVNNISIPAKSLEAVQNTVRNAGLWSALFIVLIPVVTLMLGLYVWNKRRRQ